MMLRHTWLMAMAALLLFGGLGAVGFYLFNQPAQLKVAVGPPNSEDVRVMQAIAQQLARDASGLRLRLIIKDGGTREAAKSIDSGEADVAVVRRDVAMPKDGQAVAILRKNVAVFIVPPPEPAKPAAKPAPRAAARRTAAKAAAEKKPAIEKFEDLIGRRLGIIGRSQGNIDLLKAILRQHNIGADKIVILGPDAQAQPNAPDKINVVQLDPNNVTAAVRDSKADAFLAVGPVSSPITADAIAAAARGKEPPTFLAVDGSEAITERNPIYESTEIKAGAFGGAPPRPDESIETIGVNHYIVAHRKLSQDVVANFLKQLFAVRNALTPEMASAAKIEAPDTEKGASVPVHPGAAAFIDGEMKTFIERYNELLYLGLMVLSFLGSGLAGIWSYSKSGDRILKLKALDDLVNLTKAARSAESAGALDELQAQADEAFAKMVRDVANNAFDETTLSAFSVSFDQVRAAIADRRAVLKESTKAPTAETGERGVVIPIQASS